MGAPEGSSKQSKLPPPRENAINPEIQATIKSHKDDNRVLLHTVLPLETPLGIGVFQGDVCNLRCKYPYLIDFGNIHDETIYDIFNGEKRRDFLRLMLERRRFTNSVCRDCISPDLQLKPEDDLDEFADDLLEIF